MSFAIIAGVGVGASLLATGYSIYSSEQQQARAKQIANKADQDEKTQEALASFKRDQISQQQAQAALTEEQGLGVGYTRGGTILSGGAGGIGTQGANKSLIGQ